MASFFVAASHSQFIRRGDHQIEVERQDLGGVHQQFWLNVTYHAIAARDIEDSKNS